jgi:hypothetical protein
VASKSVRVEPSGGASESELPRIAFCEEKKRLMSEFLDAIHQLGELHAAQSKALIEGDHDFARFDLLIFMANEKKDNVKYAWLNHIEQHRC